jgi:hypothetical protein
MKTHLKIIFTSFIAVILGSCSLELQESFEFEPEVFTQGDPFKNLTAWEFIQTKITERNENNEFLLKSNTSVLNQSGDNLDFFVAAIKAVGYEEFYNQTSTSNRTYFLLNNNAFTGNSPRDIVRMITGAQLADGSAAGRLVNPDNVFINWTPAQLNQLKAVLRYNMVNEYVDQNTVPTSFVHILRKTLLPEANLDLTGTPVSLSNNPTDIAFFRDGDSRQTLRINRLGAPLPSTATETAWDENVRRHNYVFKNGVGHFLQEIVRFQPYNLYNNLVLP